MEKTNLGLTPGTVGAGCYLLSLFGGYTAALLLVGYVLLFENYVWLRRTAVKAAVVTVLFSLAGTVIGLIPDALRLIQETVFLFGGYFDMSGLYSLESLLTGLLNLAELALMLLLSLKAFREKDVTIGFIDGLVSKCVE